MLPAKQVSDGGNRQQDGRDQRRNRPQSTQLPVCYPKLEERKILQALPIVLGHAQNFRVTVETVEQTMYLKTSVPDTSNENKMSCAGRGRASLQVEGF